MINLCSVKAFGEAEFFFSTLKVTAVIGFMSVVFTPEHCGQYY
jgi:amino acid permease